MPLGKKLCVFAVLSCSQLLLAAPHRIQVDSRSDEHRLADEIRATGWKVENGLVLSWRATSSQRSNAQVTVHDTQSHVLCSAQVLALVPDASSVSIYDVSGQPGRSIAVAAVFVPSNQKQAPVDTLLYFDFTGKLVSAYALEPSREILKLSLDEHLNAWTLTAHSGGKSPSETYFVVEYGARGETKRMLVPRSTFPLHSKQVSEDLRTGGVYSGYVDGSFWFWLPGSTDFVAIDTNDGSISTLKTGLPEIQFPSILLQGLPVTWSLSFVWGLPMSPSSPLPTICGHRIRKSGYQQAPLAPVITSLDVKATMSHSCDPLMGRIAAPPFNPEQTCSPPVENHWRAGLLMLKKVVAQSRPEFAVVSLLGVFRFRKIQPHLQYREAVTGEIPSIP